LGFVFSLAPLCLVPPCGSCLLFGVLRGAGSACPQLRFPPVAFCRPLSLPVPPPSPPRLGGVSRRCGCPPFAPAFPGERFCFLAVRLCPWRGFAPKVFRCLRRFLQSCFRPFSIRLARSPSPLRMRSLCGCRF